LLNVSSSWRDGRKPPVALNALESSAATVTLIVTAAVLTISIRHVSGYDGGVFYLSAAVLATWIAGLPAGALAVAVFSVLMMHSPADPITSWEIDAQHLTRLVIVASLATTLAIMTDRVHRFGRELTRTNDKLQELLDLVPVGIAILDGTDASAGSIHINGALARMIGSNGESYDLEGEEGVCAFGSNGQPLETNSLPLHQAVSEKRLSGPHELRFSSPDVGADVHAVAHAAPLLEDGAVCGAIASYVGVTEAREREAELAHANHAKDEFLGMLSHELRTPMTIIAGNAQILLRGSISNGDEDIEAALQDISTASEHLLRNIDNLLVLSRATNHAFDLEPSRVCPIVNDLVAQHRESRHPIHVACDDVIALGVPDVIEQVLDNLLLNAEKYSDAPEPIDIVVTSRGAEVEMAVRDRGVGLAPDELEAIFDPFYRSPRTSETKPGVGLGLSVCRQMVEAMGGQIWAVSRDEGGAEFRLTLARPAELQEAEDSSFVRSG